MGEKEFIEGKAAAARLKESAQKLIRDPNEILFLLGVNHKAHPTMIPFPTSENLRRMEEFENLPEPVKKSIRRAMPPGVEDATNELLALLNREKSLEDRQDSGVDDGDREEEGADSDDHTRE